MQPSEEEPEGIPRAKIELAFIRATRDDAGTGLNGTLCRAEFFELLMRLCSTKFPKQNITGHFQEFLEVHIKPINDLSTVLRERKMIQSSK